MTLVSSHYVHLLVRGDDGWLAPVEVADDPSSAALVIPVRADGTPFPEGYWLEVAVAEQGPWKLLDEPFQFVPTGIGEYHLQTPSANIKFVDAARPQALYAGELEHPDFGHQLREVVAVEDDVFDLLCDREKVFLVGCSPFEHYRRKGNAPL